MIATIGNNNPIILSVLLSIVYSHRNFLIRNCEDHELGALVNNRVLNSQAGEARNVTKSKNEISQLNRKIFLQIG